VAKVNAVFFILSFCRTSNYSALNVDITIPCQINVRYLWLHHVCAFVYKHYCAWKIGCKLLSVFDSFLPVNKQMRH